MKYGHPFSVTEYECDCYDTPGPLNKKCSHPQRKRPAYADELTDAQLKFLFYGKQERERMKSEKAQRESNIQSNQAPQHNL